MICRDDLVRATGQTTPVNGLEPTLQNVYVVVELAFVEHPVEEGWPLRLLVVGDWGRKGMYNQSRVAAQVCLCIVMFQNSFKNSTFIRPRLFYILYLSKKMHTSFFLKKTLLLRTSETSMSI